MGQREIVGAAGSIAPCGRSLARAPRPSSPWRWGELAPGTGGRDARAAAISTAAPTTPRRPATDAYALTSTARRRTVSEVVLTAPAALSTWLPQRWRLAALPRQCVFVERLRTIHAFSDLHKQLRRLDATKLAELYPPLPAKLFVRSERAPAAAWFAGTRGTAVEIAAARDRPSCAPRPREPRNNPSRSEHKNKAASRLPCGGARHLSRQGWEPGGEPGDGTRNREFCVVTTN